MLWCEKGRRGGFGLSCTALVSLAMACGGDEPPSFDGSLIPHVSLTGVIVQTDSFAGPTKVISTPDFLIVADVKADTVFHLQPKGSGFGATKGAFGRRGEGPGEFQFVTNFDLGTQTAGDSALWIFDPVLFRVTRIPHGLQGNLLIRSLHEHRQVWDSIVTFETPVGLVDPAWITESTIVAVSLRAEGGRLAYFNARGRLIRQAGSFPSSRVASELRGKVFEGPLLLSKDRSRIVVATRLSGVLQLYTSQGEDVATASGPFSFDPVFGVRPANLRYGTPPVAAAVAEQRYGYLGLSRYKDNILALFSGRRIIDFPRSFTSGTQVHVFDWSLKFKCALLLDHEIASITTDETESAMYGITYDPSPMVVKYALGDDTCESSKAG